MHKIGPSWLAIAVSFLAIAGSSAAQVTSKHDPAATPRLGFPSHWAGHTGLLTKQRSLAPALPHSYSKLPLSFEKNQGQVAPDVKFIARGPGYAIFLKPDEAVLSLHAKSQMGLMYSMGGDVDPKAVSDATAFLRLRLEGTNPAAIASGEDELSGKANYFIGNDPQKWRTNISTYAKVEVKDIYPGIDLVYYGNQRQLEYDYVVAPGADPNRIRFNIKGARKLQLDSGGDLILQTAAGEVSLKKPVMYQYRTKVEDDDPPYEREAAKKYVDGHFKIQGKNEVVFVAGEYDHGKELTIDPALAYSTFLGGSANDVGISIAVDASGNAYISGDTESLDFPVTSGAGGWQAGYGGTAPNCTDTTKLSCGDAFVTEINSTGTAVVYSAYLGGSDADSGNAIAVDSSGNAYVAGSTRSANFPVVNSIQQYGGGTCHQGTRPCADAFVAKIAPGGASLIYSTFIGGSLDDIAFGLALDANGNAFITGGTVSSNFPTTANAVSQVLDNSDGSTVENCTGNGGGAVPCEDAFVVEISEVGGVPAETYGTFLGGADQDLGIGIAVDSSDNIFVVGTTDSSSFPGIISGTLQSTYGGGSPPNCVSQFICGDGFVTELAVSSDGTTIDFSSYLGGSGDDAATAIALDGYGDLLVAGTTDSTNFPVTDNAIQPTFGGGSSSCAGRLLTCGDAFAVEIYYADGQDMYFSTYIGGSGDDGVWKGAAVDSNDNFYIAGTTNSPNFPTANPFQASYGGPTPDTSCDASNDPCGDGFVTEISGDLTGYVFSTYLGGSGDDGIAGLALDNLGDIFVTGYTSSPNFPTTTGAYKTSCGTDGNCNGLSDAFVTEFGVPPYTGPYQPGQVFVAGANGGVYVFQPDGTLLGVMNTGQTLDTGMAFDQTGNLYVTTFDGLDIGNPPVGIVKFDSNANLVGAFGSFPPADDSTAFPESILFNLAGNALVGAATYTYACGEQAPTVPAFEFNPSGALLNTFNLIPECRGTDWVELLPDQQTLLYTSEGTSVKSYNVSTLTQNPDFATGLPGAAAYAFRAVPDGTVLVADTSEVVRLSSTGQIIQTYNPVLLSGNSYLFALNLDPDGVSFWTADGGTGTVYKFNIANGGDPEVTFTSPSGHAGGLAVFGEKAVGTNNITVTENGSGTGTVTSSPVGINCPTVCLAPFADNSTVTLVGAAASGSTFAGFSSNCTPVNSTTCTVALGTADVNVTATFNTAASYELTVTDAGTGTGTVTSQAGLSPAINCTTGSTTGCSASYISGTVITLTPTAATGSTFAGWSGACTGTGSCIVTMNAAESVTATFTATTYALTVTDAGTGSGTVTSQAGLSPAINCTTGSTTGCSANYNSGTVVTLTAAAGTGSAFAGWSGACTGTSTCTVTMSAAESVTATFNTTYALTVTDAGTGTGTVTSQAGLSPAINCTTGSTTGCSASYISGTVITLTPTAATGSTFAGWSGACTGTGSCIVTMNAAESMTATFTATTYALTVTDAGTGTGTVTSNPAGISCTTGSTAGCSANYNSGTMVTLTAAAGTGSAFAGWGGACSGTGSCVVTMNAAESVTATFNTSVTFALTVTEAGTGTGTVTSAPAGISCPSTCSASYTSGTVVTLSEVAGTGSTFAGWSGACTGTGTCAVTMSAAESVTATFNTSTFALTVTKAGTGTGTVTSSPAGINCGSTCSANFNSGSPVTLTASAGTGSTFAGWSGNAACSGTGTCTITMSAAESVTATFNTSTFALTVTEAGTGFGTVSSNPAGILCPSTCSAPFTTGSQVTLTVTANSGSTFVGWSGAGCSGVGVCTVTMSAAESVTATFNTSTTFALTVTETGTGSGTVTSNPSGISCPSTCSANYASGTVVTLTETPASGSTFAGWSGACTGTGTCTVTMNAAENVTAMFNTTASPTLTIVLNGTGTGSVTFTSSSTYTCSDTTGVVTGTCSASFPSGTVVNLSEGPGTGSTFGGWSGGGCSGAGSTCNVTLTTNTTVTATFNKGTYTLTVTDAGTGTGTVTSSPAGINCTTGSTTGCAASFTSGTVVTVTATAASGSTFVEWGGQSCGGNTCTILMNSAQSVTATFDAVNTYALTVAEAGTGSGTVTSSPAGITCPSTCSANFNSGTVVTLTETAGSGSTFAGWSGACSGTGTCTVTMNAAEAVTATFNTGSTFTFAPSAGSSTSVTTTPGGNIVVGFTLTGTVKETVDLGCTSSAPQYLSCLITPNVVNLTGTGTTQVAIVLTSYCQGEVPGGPAPGRGLPPVGGVGVLLLALTLVGMAWSYGRRRRWVVTMAGLLIITLSGAACGNLPQGPNGVTPAGNYVLTITATVAGQAPQLVQVNVKVN